MTHHLRIALISEHASPAAILGGADAGGQNVYVDQLARHLARDGHAVDVFTRREAADAAGLPVLAIPIALLVAFSLHNPEPEGDQGLREYFGSVWEHIKDRRVVGLFVASLVTFVILFGSS